MRNLRLYYTDAAFKASEQAAGGDGLLTESIVPGVSITKDLRKRYFNPHDKEILFHTLTVNYKDSFGNLIADSDTIRFKYIPGVNQEIVVTPEDIEGYAPIESKKIVSIPSVSAIDFTYSSPLGPSQPLTLRIISGGTICWKNYDSDSPSYTKTILYSLNGSELVSITSSSGGTSFNVNDGDVVQIKGNNSTYTEDAFHYNTFSGSTAKFEVEGNIMSLINSENFANISALTKTYAFYRLFKSCTGLTTAENLLLPASVLTSACYAYLFWECSNMLYGPKLPATQLVYQCYRSMFRSCTNLKIAPELESTYLVTECYREMFYDCKNLNYIKCLATNIPQTRCTDVWVEGVSSAGTFVKNPNMVYWTRGTNGIPTNWTVQDA